MTPGDPDLARAFETTWPAAEYADAGAFRVGRGYGTDLLPDMSDQRLLEIVRRFDEAPLAYALSALAAVVYILATLALVLARRRGWYSVAWVAIVFELTGVLVVGVLSLLMPDLFQHETVWSLFGRGYLFIPLVLPVFGIWWLRTHRPADVVRPVEVGA